MTKKPVSKKAPSRARTTRKSPTKKPGSAANKSPKTASDKSLTPIKTPRASGRTKTKPARTASKGRKPSPSKPSQRRSDKPKPSVKTPDKAPTLPPKSPPKMGRPSAYTKEMAEKICIDIAEGKSLRVLCNVEGYPHPRTVHRWLVQDGPDFDHFRQQYARARAAQGILFGERVMEAALLVQSGLLGPKEGRVAMYGFMWAASRLAPKVFGDKIDVRGSLETKVTSGVLAVSRTPESLGEWLAAGGLTEEEVVIDGRDDGSRELRRA